MNIHTIRPRRLFVTGASRLTPNAALLWRELGRLLALDKHGPVVITGGLASRINEPGALTADRMIIDGMLPVLGSQGIASEQRIETFLPDEQRDWNKLIRFKEGRLHMLKNRNAQSRRFSMVHSVDVVVSVEGEKGTQSVLDVALAIERPILPLPFGGGASSDAWHGQREDVLSWFQIDAQEADDFERIRLAELDEPQIQALAARVHCCLMRGFTQGCFVIMRFGEKTDPVYDQAIVPALAAHRFQPWRTDRTVHTGDVMEAIRDGINHCYFVIADTTGDRPNVMYELGLAHAAKKRVILLRHENPDGSLPNLPFDFGTQSIQKYGDDLDDLRRRLEAIIGVLRGKGNSADGES